MAERRGKRRGRERGRGGNNGGGKGTLANVGGGRRKKKMRSPISAAQIQKEKKKGQG
jgi:hypothetical protein